MKFTGLSIFMTALVAATPALARDGSVLIHGARVFDGTRMLGVRDVLVTNGRIAAVARRLKAPAGIETVEANGRTLIPGLIDGHVHVFPGAQADALRFGVTTVFDMYSTADRSLASAARVGRQGRGSGHLYGRDRCDAARRSSNRAVRKHACGHGHAADVGANRRR